MTKIGIVEGFFGPEWSHEARLSYAPFLKKYGGDFYIYAPKRDAFLRKAWREEWPSSFLDNLTSLKNSFHAHQLKFGIGISPFGLGTQISEQDWKHLKEKLGQLKNLGIDYVGLFFDDMPVSPDLLKVQTEVAELTRTYFPHGLIFCPSYYTYDPILDKVFGQRPVGYVEGLKDAIAPDIKICWTGPKVISEEISRAHLEEVTQLLGRKPFIWENLYANDGPRNCKFLKLKYFTGRDSSLLTQTDGLGFNLMNEAYLSQLVYLSSLWVMEKKLSPREAFEQSCYELYNEDFAKFMIRNRALFLETGLDKLTEEQKQSLSVELAADLTPAALEVKSWLSGEYMVGPECLTD